MSFTSRFTAVAFALAALAAPGFAGQYSFTGNFSQDNDVQLFTFSLASASTVTLQTLGYGGSADNAGGTNANGQVISAGGFESVMQIYASPSGVAAGPTFLPGVPGPPNCAPLTPDPNRAGFCQDVFGQINLSAGDYIVSLTQWQNIPLGDLSDGFNFVDSDPNPNFNSGFFGTGGFPGDNHWALDILFVDAAAQVPEPSYGWLAAAALLAGIGARKMRPLPGPRT